jgi:hypothetical protein
VIQPTWTAELCLMALQHLTGCLRLKTQTQNQLQTISTKSNSNSQGPPVFTPPNQVVVCSTTDIFRINLLSL